MYILFIIFFNYFYFGINLLNMWYDVAKKSIIWCIWCNAMCLCGLRFKKHILFHILYIIVAPLCPAFLKCSIFTKLIVLKSEVCSDWPAIQSVVIGRTPQACDGNVTPLTVFGNTQCLTTWRRQKYYSENKSYAAFLCVNVWAVLCKSSHTVT